MAGTGMMLQEADGERLLVAVRRLLEAKGIASTAEIAERIAVTDRASPGQGAAHGRPRLDRSRLSRADGRGWQQGGRNARHPDARHATARRAGERAGSASPRGLHALQLLPRAVLGYPPYWFKSAGYRARAVRDPRGLIAEWGTVLPDDTKVTVVDSTADYRWMVLPQRPAGTEDWTETQLAAIVREGDMIGVTVPKRP